MTELSGYQAEQAKTSWFQPTDGSFSLSFILKLQTARYTTLKDLQTRDLVENDRLDELYLPMGGLGGQKPQITPKNAKKHVFIKK